ncbi:hypothetical protein MNEG_15691 [Monoraphidium neglectum]|uniref:Uncharacterized protein n=1 Tax=Monoraphidium neglectum TaxID=145388 RepID=A0A0D2IWD8_9CHLO|nr:hypothetical protein MNEG_15691 [Monoraphidium neglectum]KIY92272.1 hypothetical protein MNEG_15691 [Monoraphidium neglectum]|eukprot:XP_013891292.1 hypothetical protein MNEG_15691 [Monoraphidium neglectum]
MGPPPLAPPSQNACATLAIPVAIFDQDIRPKKGGPPTGPRLIKHAQVPQEPYDGGKPTTCCGAHAAVAAAQADE